MIYVGIDPGFSGAFVALDENKLCCAARCPTVPTGRGERRGFDVPAMLRLIESVYAESETIAAMEKVHAMPKQGVSSTFRFGEGYGIWQGLLAGHRIPYELVRPQEWQGTTLHGSRTGTSRKATKNAAVLVAKRLFPTLPIIYKSDWGMADAALIAEHLRRSWTHGG